MAVSIDDQTRVLRYIWTYPGLNFSHFRAGMTIPARRIQAALEQLLADGRIQNDIKKLGDVEAVVYYPIIDESDTLIDIVDKELPRLFERLKEYPETEELAERLNKILDDFKEGRFEDDKESESEDVSGSVSRSDDTGEIERVEEHAENW